MSMFQKKNDNPFAKGGHTILDNALEIVGDVHFAGELDIEGTVKGNIIAQSPTEALVQVRPLGQVIGEIHAPKVIINGLVQGDVYCSTHLELLANAVVNGNVHYKVIEMVKGAQVNGSLMHIVEEQQNVVEEDTEQALGKTT
ncbi:protein CcmA, bactofilin family [Alteromonadaceae bacterium Bs31]|nr:protein CcmA, bactofilin family [Alteromonadaceae bacterium Bs31]